MSWRAFRNGLQTVHLWAGLILSIPFILIGLTGSLIVLIDGFADFSIPSASKGESQSLQRIYEAAKAAAPEAWSVAALVMPSREGEAYGAQLQLPPGRRPAAGQNFIGSTLYIDPVSLKVLDNVERRRNGPVMRTLTSLHIALMMPGFYGVRIVGFMGIAMSLFGITGLVLWWPRRGQWRQAFWVKRGVKGFRFNRDLHGATGFWSLIVFMILSVSGVYLAFPVTFQSTVASVFSIRNGLTEAHADATTIASIPNKEAITPDDAVKLALAAVPRSRALSVQLPPDPGGIYMVALAPRPYGDDAPQISAFVGPGTEISDVVDPRSYAVAKRVLMWLRVLHYGNGLGVVWRVLVFFSGFLPLLFAITGVRMWWLKRAQRLSAATAPEGAVAISAAE
ncbi:MAG TPA: PepSY-associated TM helix domain-containing protein [Micropepsaceae bacterium]|nr:PepSY-associated TM helix domain-containing protein [Micropepsaceae bacterium]